MPSFNRFAASKYRNQLLEPAKLDGTFQELPALSPVASPNARSIACGDKYLAMSLGDSVGLVDWSKAKKLGGKIEKVGAGSSINDHTWCAIENEVLGIATDSGAKVVKLAGEELNLASSDKISTIQFHPQASSLVSLTTPKTIDIHNVTNSSPSLSIPTTDVSKQHFWSLPGNQLVSYSTSNVVSLFDPRASLDSQLEIKTGYQQNRASVSALLDDNTILATGAASSIRSLKLFDLRSPSSPKSTISFDSTSSPSSALVPLVDTTRRLAYIVQCHSSSVYAFDFNEANPVPSTLQLPSTLVGGCLLPETAVDVMQAEINRLFILTRNETVVPISVRIQRRSYMDFHADLFPDIFVPSPSLGADEWLKGDNKLREKVSLDPQKAGWRDAGTTETQKEESIEAEAETAKTQTPLTPASSSIPESETPKFSDEPKILQSKVPSSSQAVPAPPATPYTRKFLTGRTHHPKTHFTSLPPHPTTTSLYRLLHATSETLAFPINGPGGRIAFLSLSNPGRHETPPILSTDMALVDFSLSPHRNGTLASAGEDGRVKIWKVEDADQALGTLETEKVVQVEWHPLAEGLLGVLCTVSGKHEFQLWDWKNGSIKKIDIPPAFGFSWNREGTKIVVAGGDNAVYVIDPREDKVLWKGKDANSSSRAYRAIFCGELVVTVGFARGSSRQICLFDGTSETPVQRITLDMSPSALIPHYDDDTNILFLWSKGSRQIHSYYITSSPPEITTLPSFDSADLQNAVAFLPKSLVDVEKVEIIQGLRLAGGNKIERFGFTIPRNRTEFFQDDIFVPTFDTQVSVLSAQDWLSGQNAQVPTIDLRPKHMTPLSQAPSEKKATPKKTGSSFQRVMTEKEREEQAMQEMFSKAKKLDVSDEEIEGIPKTGNTDAGFDDDDWA